MVSYPLKSQAQRLWSQVFGSSVLTSLVGLMVVLASSLASSQCSCKYAVGSVEIDLVYCVGVGRSLRHPFPLFAGVGVVSLPECVKHFIEYLQYIRGLILDSFNVPRNDVTTSLIPALATRVRLDTSDRIRNISEMMLL